MQFPDVHEWDFSTLRSNLCCHCSVVATRKCRINCNETLSPLSELDHGSDGGATAEVDIILEHLHLLSLFLTTAYSYFSLLTAAI